jgi:hypothetical protein
MRVANEDVLPFASRLTFGSAPAPRAAVLALFTLVPAPLDLLCVAAWEAPGHQGPAAWTLVGLDEGGVAIVRVTVEPGAPVEVQSARWHPTAHVRCVGVEAVELFQETPGDDDYVGQLSWLLRIEGEGELHLPVPDDGDASRIEEFCRRVQDLLRAPRDE